MMKLLTNILIPQFVFRTAIAATAIEIAIATAAADTPSQATAAVRSSWSIDSIVNTCRKRGGSYESSDTKKNNADRNVMNTIRRVFDLTIPHTVDVDGGGPQEIEKLEQMIQHLEKTYFVSCNDDTTGGTANNSGARDNDGNDDDDRGNKNIAVNIQMAIVIVSKMSTEDVPWHYSVDHNIERFATRIHNELGVGQCCDGNSIGNTGSSSGIVLFISVEDRAMYVSTSDGIQSILTSSRLNTILNHNMTPYLKRGDYHTAVSAFINAVEEYFISGPPSLWEQYIDLVTILGFVSLGFVNKYRESRNKRKYAEVYSKLDKLDKERALLLMGQYECTSCPICLENFQLGSVQCSNDNNDKNDNINHPVDDDSTAKGNANSNDVIGSDGLPVRILRCGHAFDESCWQEWILKGSKSSLDVTNCPVCKMDLNSTSNSSSSSSNNNDNQSTTTATITAATDDNNNDNDNDNDENNYDVLPLSASSSSSATNTNLNWYRAERNFRLIRIGYRYPGYVRPSQLDRWMNTNYNENLTFNQDFVRNKPATSNDFRSDGSNNNGSSSSSRYRYDGGGFGDGRSSGGCGSHW